MGTVFRKEHWTFQPWAYIPLIFPATSLCRNYFRWKQSSPTTVWLHQQRSTRLSSRSILKQEAIFELGGRTSLLNGLKICKHSVTSIVIILFLNIIAYNFYILYMKVRKLPKNLCPQFLIQYERRPWKTQSGEIRAIFTRWKYFQNSEKLKIGYCKFCLSVDLWAVFDFRPESNTPPHLKFDRKFDFVSGF